jgi:hypothetical protein
LKIEILAPLRLVSPDGTKQEVLPGEILDIPEAKALKLLAKVPQKVRIVPSLQPGWVVEWQSQIFGTCSGKVVSVKTETVTITDHSVLKQEVTLPASWIQGIYREELAS